MYKLMRFIVATIITVLLWLTLESMPALSAFETTPEVAADANSDTAKSSVHGNDVRIVIDISGSMKKTDPQNLRVPALRLITNLLPGGTDAGIWTFGQYVNNLVPVRPVNPAWQAQATAAAAQINSLGQFTNIPDALIRAADGWDKPSNSARHLILLTDGYVDVGKEPGANEQAHERVVGEILSKLKEEHVHIHTIALSRDADIPLLQKLSQETDGLSEVAESAEALNKIFLRIFTQAAPRDTVPLTDNRFQVDASVEEFTLLVFRKADSKATALIMPNGKRFSAEHVPDGWKWFADSRYDLVTVSKPSSGQWNLDADVDPDNRVMVVSNLKLQVGDLPSMVLTGEQLDVTAYLLEDDKVITRPDFLALAKAHLLIQRPQLNDAIDVHGNNEGAYVAHWSAPQAAEPLTLTMLIESPTFQRSRVFALQSVAAHLNAERVDNVADGKAADDKKVTIKLGWTADVFAADSLKLSGEWGRSDAHPDTVAIATDSNPAVVTVEAKEPGDYQFVAVATAKSMTGRALVLHSDSVKWTVAAVAAPVPAPVAAAATPAPTDAHSAGFWWAIAGLINLLLIVIGVTIWWLIRRRQRNAAAAIDEALG